MDDNQWPAVDNTRKDPDEWKTGDDPMTGAQKSVLHTMTGKQVPDDLSKADASKMIDELRANKSPDQKDNTDVTGIS